MVCPAGRQAGPRWPMLRAGAVRCRALRAPLNYPARNLPPQARNRLVADALARPLPPLLNCWQSATLGPDFNYKEEMGPMKRAIRFAVAASCFFLMSMATAVAQDQYTEGGVTRVTLVQILPGHFNAFMDDLKNNIKPLWEAEKKAGLIDSYGIFLNSTKANPDDWDIGFALGYKNFAALDGLAQKVLDIRMQQFGDKSKEQKVIDKRVENARVVTSVLTREITLK